MVIFKASKEKAVVFIAVSEGGHGIVVAVESPTHPCFAPDFVRDRWEEVRPRLEEEGFEITEGGQA